MANVTVLGQGQVGRWIAARLREGSHHVAVSDIDGWREIVKVEPDLFIISVTTGEQSLEVVETICEGSKAPIVDLTTQELQTVRRSVATAARHGVRYTAGGLTGGANAVREGRARLLLGPAPMAEHLTVLSCCGESILFHTAMAAVCAKLIHNWHLLVGSWSLAVAVELATSVGIEASIGEVIATGPAGRTIPTHSLYRDWAGKGTTTYAARLALKDCRQIRSSFPELFGQCEEILGWLETAFGNDPSVPFTEAILDGVRREFQSDGEHQHVCR